MKEYIKRGMISFAISSFAGVLVNLIIDSVVNASGKTGFISMSPDYIAMFPTTALAAYVNALLYGVIGFTFAFMTFIYDVERLGFLYQSIIFFLITAAVCIAITTLLWQLHKHPTALICTLSGYAVTHVIMFVKAYRNLKKDINEINEYC